VEGVQQDQHGQQERAGARQEASRHLYQVQRRTPGSRTAASAAATATPANAGFCTFSAFKPETLAPSGFAVLCRRLFDPLRRVNQASG